MEMHVVYAENFKLDAGACFGVVPKTLWSKQVQADENNLIDIYNRLLLIKEDNKLILIDAGIGNKLEEKVSAYYYISGKDNLEKSFQSLGYSFNDVTDIILTHLHFDHVGGVFKMNDEMKTEPVFPNASYWCSEVQWLWATVQPNSREKASFFPINLQPLTDSGKLNLIKNEQQFSENIFLKILNGHTVGQIMPIINYRGRKIVYAADFIPSSAHIHVPFVPGYDIQPLVSLEEKEIFLKEAFENNYILFFEHDADHECCTLQLNKNKFEAKVFFCLDEIK